MRQEAQAVLEARTTCSICRVLSLVGVLGLAGLAGLTGLAGMSGCEMERRVVRSGWDDFPADPKPSAEGATEDGEDRTGWAVPLQSFQGTQRRQQAEALLNRLRQAGASDLWVEHRGDTATVYAGQYRDPDSKRARQGLEKVRNLAFADGTQPYKAAKLVPVTGGATQTADPMNLKQYGGFYSLQIGAYDDNHPQGRRKAAEARVQELRDQGQEAYFYHGPNLSMVTVGLFAYEEAFVQVNDPLSEYEGSMIDTASPRVRELQEKFPHNLLNGEAVAEVADGKVLGKQESALVRVP